MSAEAKFAEGTMLMRNGEKAVAKTVFRWKPDWETAASEFGRAAVAFKNAKAWEQCKEAYIRASDAHYNNKSLFTAATNLESAAQMSKELKRYEEAAQLFQRASRVFLEHGQADNAANTLSRGAQLLASVDAAQALEVYSSALELYESEGREAFGMDTYKASITLALKSKQFEKAIEVLDKIARVYVKLDTKASLHKTAVTMVIVHLSREDEIAARNKVNELAEYEAHPGFGTTEEYRVALELIEAYESHDQDQVNAVAQKQFFNFLDAEATRLVRQLKVGGGNDSVM